MINRLIIKEMVGYEKDERINLSNSMVWIQTVFV